MNLSKTTQIWLGCSILANIFAGLWGFFAKLAANEIPGSSIKVWAFLGNATISIIILLSTKAGEASSRKRGRLFAILAGTVNGFGAVAFYCAMNRGGDAAVVVPLTSLFPPVTMLLAIFLLKEKVSTLREWLGILLSLVAVVLFAI